MSPHGLATRGRDSTAFRPSGVHHQASARSTPSRVRWLSDATVTDGPLTITTTCGAKAQPCPELTRSPRRDEMDRPRGHVCVPNGSIGLTDWRTSNSSTASSTRRRTQRCLASASRDPFRFTRRGQHTWSAHMLGSVALFDSWVRGLLLEAARTHVEGVGTASE